MLEEQGQLTARGTKKGKDREKPHDHKTKTRK